MKQLGNLAIACARRSDVIMLIKEGKVTVVVNHIDGIGTKTLETAWDDDERIGEICHELNHGSLARGDVL